MKKYILDGGEVARGEFFSALKTHCGKGRLAVAVPGEYDEKKYEQRRRSLLKGVVLRLEGHSFSILRDEDAVGACL